MNNTRIPQDTIVEGVWYNHTHDPMGHICPMHYNCTMTIEHDYRTCQTPECWKCAETKERQ